MTTEEKAKAYEMALEVARKELGVDRKEWEVVEHVLRNIFPELRESEDERIRKKILNLVKKHAVNHERCQMENYLEKQKDASYAIEAVDRIDKYIDEHLANAHDMKDSNPDKKYYRGWDDALGKMAGILQDVYSGEKQKEQKPAEWSDYKDKVNVPYCSSEPKWSEELDIDTLREWSMRYAPDIRQAIESTAYHFYNLRPSWKPSEEQMEAFRGYIEDFQARAEAAVGGWNNFDVMIRLYEQLKQL